MPTKIFTVYDSKTEAYLPPFFNLSRGSVFRSIEDAVNDPNHHFCKYSSDFTLFELGSFCESTATFVLHSAPISLGCLIEYRKSSVSA